MKNLLAACIVLFAAHANAAEKGLLDKARVEGRAAFYANITAVEPIMKAFAADTGVKAECNLFWPSRPWTAVCPAPPVQRWHGAR